MVNSGKSTATSKRRRLSIGDRRAELLGTCLDQIGTRPWDEVTMADIAAAAGVSKPLLYHYFSTKPELYLATIESAADELRSATQPDPTLPAAERTRASLDAHLDWIDEHAFAYRAVVQGGISSDAAVQVIVERSRTETIERLADGLGWDPINPTQRIALRGWVGFLEAASLEWLDSRTIERDQLAELLTGSVTGLLPTVDVRRHTSRTWTRTEPDAGSR